ncbi:MAG: lipoyl domain-containing protein [Candidatus Omnitrophica bacterium]|nr:lipoyl domain-containing protein [Candidatus Omnitrophota bacterium]
MIKVVLPELGEGITKAIVSYWFFKDGERVNQNDDLVELTTDKSTFNLPSPCTGVISEIMYSEGDTVNIGQILAVINES